MSEELNIVPEAAQEAAVSTCAEVAPSVAVLDAETAAAYERRASAIVAQGKAIEELASFQSKVDAKKAELESAQALVDAAKRDAEDDQALHLRVQEDVAAARQTLQEVLSQLSAAEDAIKAAEASKSLVLAERDASLEELRSQQAALIADRAQFEKDNIALKSLASLFVK